jgi:hypothetical protein
MMFRRDKLRRKDEANDTLPSELELIRQEAHTRGISRLCHFTQARKLPHILTEVTGIYSVEWLRTNRPDLLDSNDQKRLDGYPNHISCSIEYANSWYWQKAKSREELFKDWVVLLIKPDVLWREKTRFCYRNCAALQGGAQEGYNAFLEMFKPEVVGAYRKKFTRTPQMLPCCPTDGQAEALVHEQIGLDMLLGVAVQNEEQAQKERSRLELVGILPDSIKWIVAPSLFYASWNNLVKQGKRPSEKIVLSRYDMR